MHPDYARLAQQSSDAIFRWMFSTGLVYANPGFGQITGKRLRGGRAASETLVVRLAGDNVGRGWIELSLVPVVDERGQVVGIDGVGRDVSQHLAVADQLTRPTIEQATLLPL